VVRSGADSNPRRRNVGPLKPAKEIRLFRREALVRRAAVRSARSRTNGWPLPTGQGFCLNGGRADLSKRGKGVAPARQVGRSSHGRRYQRSTRNGGGGVGGVWLTLSDRAPPAKASGTSPTCRLAFGGNDSVMRTKAVPPIDSATTAKALASSRPARRYARSKSRMVSRRSWPARPA